MSYNSNMKEFSRTKITLVEIDLDQCTRTFGVDPCSAVSPKCFNTVTTCKYKPAYAKTVRTYRFCDSDIVGNLDGYRPYLKDIQVAPTELQEDKTVPQRITLQFIDGPDTDIDNDPYFESRGLSVDQVPGTYFKKLVARNANLKKKVVRIKEGFLGDDLSSDFQSVATVIIDDYEFGNGTFTLKCVDILKSLSDYKYPFRVNAVLTDAIPQIHEASSEEEMLKLPALVNDYAKRRDFIAIKNLAITPHTFGSLPAAVYIYRIYAFDAYGFVLAYAEFIYDTESYPQRKSVSFTWDSVPGVSYYRIYGNLEGSNNYHQTTQNGYSDSDGSGFTSTLKAPEYRLFKFFGGRVSDISNWEQTDEEFTVRISDTSMLTDAGYLKIDDEIIHYTSITTTPYKLLRNVERGLFQTSSPRHDNSSIIYFIVSEEAGNPFQKLKKLLNLAGIEDSYIDTDKFNSLQSSWSSINVSCKPIVKETDLGKLYFDLVNILDAKSWQNESGKITIKLNSETTIKASLSDEENIIQGSGKVDNNQKEIYTRVSLYWDMYDSTKSQTDKEAYSKLNMSIDSDAESEFEYNDELNKIMYSVWINIDSAIITDLNSYVNDLLEKKLIRFRDPRPIISIDVEMKDAGIKVGDIITLKTDELNNIYGYDFIGDFEVIKRESKGNLISLSCRYFNSLKSITIDNSKLNLKYIYPKYTIEVIKDEIETLNLKYFDGSAYQGGNNLSTKLNKNEITFQWDNGFTRTDLTITDIAGVSQTFTDSTLHKLVYGYNVYMFTADDSAELKKSSLLRPGTADSNGKWQLVKFIPDRKINDVDFKYTYTHKNLKVGKHYDFYISQMMRFDSVKLPVKEQAEG